MNRLRHEDSPYLLQHADNPVDWHPWAAEPFRIARERDMPLLLSIGYSACHWCHVMAHESFEDAATAEVMNKLFVNIKVDREERPDVDDIYMGAVQAISGGGGWPLTVFLLPDGRPFYGGTYFPKVDRGGMPSFTRLLHAVHDAFRNQRDTLEKQADNLRQALNRDVIGIGGDAEGLTAHLLDEAARKLIESVDRRHGGFGAAPKFPNPISLEFLLRHHHRSGDAEALELVELTLRKMACGGIYDQIGGGFARYSVDAHWLVPHFEKMLYDNAQLSRLYLHAWQITGDVFFKSIALDIYAYILREMTGEDGGFYSATDADSEGEEGKFFVWTIDEARAALEPLESEMPDPTQIAVETFGMSGFGNFEGSNILHLPEDPRNIAEDYGMSQADFESALRKIKSRLYEARQERVPPALDDKILTSWNGMTIASIAEAARVLNDDRLRMAAEKAGAFLRDNLVAADGRLYRTHKAGRSKLNAYLEDYANLIDAWIEMYQLTYDESWFSDARRLADFTLAHFGADDGGFYDTSDDHEALIVRPRNLQDNVTPSGNGMLAKQLLRLAAYTGEARYEEAARRVLRQLSGAMRGYPQAFAEYLNAVDMLVEGIDEVAVVGDVEGDAARNMLRALNSPYRPNVVRAAADAALDSAVPLLQGRSRLDGRTTAYVCRNFSCRLPVTEAADLAEQLNKSERR